MPTKTTIAEAAQAFFVRYNDRNVSAMIELFKPEAIIEYVPFSLSGPVEQIGPGSWGVLLDAFPNLRNEVNSVCSSDDGRFVHVDVNIKGTQAKDAFGVESKGRSCDIRHLFVFEFGKTGDIVYLTSFWDNAEWYRQLGKHTID
ncbi:MAG: ester cyclase [Cyanobacteria bacterium J06621_11]